MTSNDTPAQHRRKQCPIAYAGVAASNPNCIAGNVDLFPADCVEEGCAWWAGDRCAVVPQPLEPWAVETLITSERESGADR